jgi:hypothetical protein
MRRLALLAGAVLALVTAAASPAAARAESCPHWGRPAVAADARPHALRVFAIQFAQHPAQIATAAARALLRMGRGCGHSDCLTQATLDHINTGYRRALTYLQERYPKLSAKFGRGFVAATDTFVRVFMTTMATEARRYHLYIVASNTQAPFALTRNRAAVAALRDRGAPNVKSVYAPTAGAAYDQTFVWGPREVHRRAPAPLANLVADNRKVPLTAFEVGLGFSAGPAGGAAARRNLRPVAIPGSGARLGIATSLPAFTYNVATPAQACEDVAQTYMRCLDRLVPGDDDSANRTDAGSKPQFLALAPWAVPDGSRATLRTAGQALFHSDRYVQTALVADLPFPADRSRAGCVMAGR